MRADGGPLSESDHVFSVRLTGSGPEESRAYARNHTILVGRAASFRESDSHPSAIELLLAALGGDLLSGWHLAAAHAGLELDAIELSLSARLENALRVLDVIGEQGSPAVARIDGTLYASTSGEAGDLERLWNGVLERSPMYQTLTRAVPVHVHLRHVA